MEQGCETAEERMAFIRENGVELTDEQLEGISGGGEKIVKGKGKPGCPKNGGSTHKWKWTGRMVPGKIWGNIWPNYELKCERCGAMDWDWFKH